MGKVHKVMSEFKEGSLHSGSKRGPVVKSRAQAIAIGLSEAREAGEKVPAKKRKKKGKMDEYSKHSANHYRSV